LQQFLMQGVPKNASLGDVGFSTPKM